VKKSSVFIKRAQAGAARLTDIISRLAFFAPGAASEGREFYSESSADGLRSGHGVRIDASAAVNEVRRRKLVAANYVPHAPFPRQQEFLSLDCFEELYGGAATRGIHTSSPWRPNDSRNSGPPSFGARHDGIF